MGYIDMHIHSMASDGELSHNEIMKQAQKNGVSLISITDHDIMLPREQWKFISTNGKKIKLVSGIELSTDYFLNDKKVRIHLLSYDAIDKSGELTKVIEQMRRARIEGNAEYISRLIKHCSFIDPSLFSNFDLSEYGWIKKLIRKNIDFENFNQTQQNKIFEFLNNENPVYNGCTLKIESAIGLVRQAGGKTSFAHPYQAQINKTKLSDDDLMKVVKDLQEMGLDAIETFHSKASAEDNEYALFLAQKFKLLESAGSDLHSLNGENDIGFGINGNMKKTSISLASQLVNEGKYFFDGEYKGKE